MNIGLSKNWMFVLVMLTGLVSVGYGQSAMALPLNLDIDQLMSSAGNLGLGENKAPSTTNEQSASDVPAQQNDTNSNLVPNELSSDSVSNNVDNSQLGQNGLNGQDGTTGYEGHPGKPGKNGLAQNGQDAIPGLDGQSGLP